MGAQLDARYVRCAKPRPARRLRTADGHHVERLAAEAGRETAVEAPFPLKLDPGALVAPRR
ncbi:hypothetical protein ACIGW0_14675 [Streptomyces bikiniensis]|uniref:Uncharacterized protein n=1 Tax=Streptomyces bikiniensis TaxID=1896 RepID=A0ABW8CSS9_STRBI